MSKMAVVGLEKHNRLSFSYPKAAFLLGVEMKVCYRCKQEKPLKEFYKYRNRGKYIYYSSWCKKCFIIKDLSFPRVFMKRIKVRCLYDKSSSYYKRGIKNFLKIKDIRYLWKRDKAHLLKKPSIHRIDNNGNYTLENCQFVELKDNLRQKRGRL